MELGKRRPYFRYVGARGPHRLIQYHMGALWAQIGRSELILAVWPNTGSTAMGPVKPATITNTTEVAEAPPVVGGCVYPSRNPRPRTLAIVFPRNSDTGYNYYYRGIRAPGCSIVRIRRPRIGATRVYPRASAALPPLHVADRHGNTPRSAVAALRGLRGYSAKRMRGPWLH